MNPEAEESTYAGPGCVRSLLATGLLALLIIAALAAAIWFLTGA